MTRSVSWLRRVFFGISLVAFGIAAACGDDDSNDTNTQTPVTSPSASEGAQTLELEGTTVFYGAEAGDNANAAAAGDFNGDDVTDVAFAAAFADGPDNERPDSGEAYIFLGPFQPGESRDAASGKQALTVYGADPGDQAGRGLTAGDIDGDGLDDLLIGAPFGDGPSEERADSGEVHVVYGSQELAGTSRTVDLRSERETTIFGAAAGGLTGFAMTTANLNGDAPRDIIIGAFGAAGPAGDKPAAGAVYTLHGTTERRATTDAATDKLVTVHGAAAGDRLGEEVAAGDVNGDGLDDLVLPAPFASGNTGIELAGRTYIIHSPAPEGPLDLAVTSVNSMIYGVDDGDQLGHATSAGDVDGDGLGDLLLTAVSADGFENTVDLAGEAALIYGNALGAEVDVAAGGASVLIFGAGETDRLGRSAAIGDIDGDGLADLLIGAPGGAGADESAPEVGELYVLFGRELPASIQLPGNASVHYGNDRGDSLASEIFGRSPILTAQMDEDAAAEIVVAAPTADGPDEKRRDSGEVYILYPSAR
jgi:hypothetical protein